MIVALARACAELFTPALRRIVALSLALAVASFIGLWLPVAAPIHHPALFGWGPLAWLGAIAVLALSWLFFPAILTIVMGFFLDRVAAAVEALDYPGRGPPRRDALLDMTVATLRLMALTVLLNLLALPVYLLMPGINFFVFLGLNGYLLGRAYFEVVALRRLDTGATRAVRHRFGGRVFLGGIVIAGLFSLPLINLVAPVI